MSKGESCDGYVIGWPVLGYVGALLAIVMEVDAFYGKLALFTDEGIGGVVHRFWWQVEGGLVSCITHCYHPVVLGCIGSLWDSVACRVGRDGVCGGRWSWRWAGRLRPCCQGF